MLAGCIACRPLYCSKGLLKVPKSSGTLVGHLSVHNIKITQKQREDQKHKDDRKGFASMGSKSMKAGK
nr:unnamed protein product [Digitaria exilis]